MLPFVFAKSFFNTAQALLLHLAFVIGFSRNLQPP